MGSKRTRSGGRKTESAANKRPANGILSPRASPEPENIPAPSIPATNDSVKTVYEHLWFWGSNDCGQIGFGENVDEVYKPRLFKFDKKIKDVACGAMHTVIALEDDTVWTLGINEESQLGRETVEQDKSNPVPEKDATRPGQVAMPQGHAPIKQVAASDCASFVLCEDGTLYGWGGFRDDHGNCNFSSRIFRKQETPIAVYKPGSSNSPMIKVVAGCNHAVGVLENGWAISWGEYDQGQLGRISLRNSRRPTVLKRNMFRPSKIGGCRGIKFVDAFCGEYSTLLKSSEGVFFAFGLNNSAQLAIQPTEGLSNADTVDISDRVNHCVTILRPTPVKSLEKLSIVKVSFGKYHTVGLSSEGEVFSWGAPTYGVLGREEVRDRVMETVPLPVPGKVLGELSGKTITDVACSQIVSACIDDEGMLYTWGTNDNAQLGYHANEDQVVPRKVPKVSATQGKKFKVIKFGGQHAAMLGSD